MREPKLPLLMMIMKCLMLGCVLDNKGGGMRILNVNNGNHDRRTDTPSFRVHIFTPNITAFSGTTFEDFPQITATHTHTRGQITVCQRIFADHRVIIV